MFRKSLLQHVWLFASSCLIPGPAAYAAEAPRSAPQSPFPPQLEVTVPFEPSVFVSDGRRRLVYELMLRNQDPATLELQELAVLDADDTSAAPVAVFDAKQLAGLLRPIGPRRGDSALPTTIGGGDSAIVYLLLTFEPGRNVPRHLRHRFRFAAGDVLGATIGTFHDAIPVLGPPVRGSGWLAETGLSNNNGHRRGNVVLDGRSVISRRYAFDWIKTDNGAMFNGDDKINASYLGYGQPVIAVANAVVASVTDGIPQNEARQALVVAMTQATIGGNNVQLALGHGRYAYYMHLQPGSLRVKAGDRVKRGQVLGLIGNSGNSFAPHLHFEITNSTVVLGGEGVPYHFDAFRVQTSEGGSSTLHRRELPLEKMVVDFGGSAGE